MITLVKRAGLRVVIFTDDHEPAHVHVFGDGHAKIDLGVASGELTIIWLRGMTKAEARRAVALVLEHRLMLLAKWTDIHG